MSIEPWNTGTDGSTGCEDMPRKSIDIRLADYPVPVEKGVVPFSCLPARTGSGRARKRVKGLLPCGFLGQRPKPSESLQESISTVFKVHLSLFFRLSFFIDYLTLPFLRFRLLIFAVKLRKIHVISVEIKKRDTCCATPIQSHVNSNSFAFHQTSLIQIFLDTPHQNNFVGILLDRTAVSKL